MLKNQNLSDLTKNQMAQPNIYFFSDSDIEIRPNSIEHAYLAIIQDDLNAAEKILINIDSPRAKWASVMLSIIKDRFLYVYPTFFQIRNFLEIDLDFLIKNKKIDYVENLLGALEIFSSINQEVYKFAGRVMFENSLWTASLKYFEESKKIFYNDPELHYLLTKYYLKMNNIKEAYFYINECLKLLPTYYPAKILKQQIEEIGF